MREKARAREANELPDHCLPYVLTGGPVGEGSSLRGCGGRERGEDSRCSRGNGGDNTLHASLRHHRLHRIAPRHCVQGSARTVSAR
jgi:hypothetical protein